MFTRTLTQTPATLVACFAVLGLATCLVAHASDDDRKRTEQNEGALPPDDVHIISEKSWDFEDDYLVFYGDDHDGERDRYIIWEDYYWRIGRDSFTVYDPRPYGVKLSARRYQFDEDGERLDDEDIMDELKDRAEEVRERRTPETYADDYYYDDYDYGYRPFGWHRYRFGHPYDHRFRHPRRHSGVGFHFSIGD